MSNKMRKIYKLTTEYDRLKEAVQKQVEERLNMDIIGIEALEWYGNDDILTAYYAYYDKSEPAPEGDVEYKYPIISDCMDVDIDKLEFEVE